MTRKRSIELEEKSSCVKTQEAYLPHRTLSVASPAQGVGVPCPWSCPGARGRGQGGGYPVLVLGWGEGQRWGRGTLSWFWLGEGQGGGYPVLVLVVSGVRAPCPGHGRVGVGQGGTLSWSWGEQGQGGGTPPPPTTTPPPSLWTYKLSKNITSNRTSYAGGKNIILLLHITTQKSPK